MRKFLRSNVTSVLEALLKFVRPVDPKDHRISMQKMRIDDLETQVDVLSEKNAFLTATLANEIPDFDAIKAAANPDGDVNTATLLDTLRKDIVSRLGVMATMNTQASAVAKLLAPIVAKTFSKISMRALVGVQPMTTPVNRIHTLRVSEGAREGDGKTIYHLAIMAEIIEARVRKLSARWTFEPSFSENGADAMPEETIRRIEYATADAISSEIATEIDQELYHAVRGLATPYDRLITADEIVPVVSRLVEDIQNATKRGRGNAVVVSNAVYRVLTMHLDFTGTEVACPGIGIQPVGWLKIFGSGGAQEEIRVYANYLTADDDFSMLIGYRGEQDMDAGFFYCPYSLVTSAGVVIDPEDFVPVMPLMTRYGAKANAGAENYYRIVTLATPVAG